jgi:hypothetical protein
MANSYVSIENSPYELNLDFIKLFNNKVWYYWQTDVFSNDVLEINKSNFSIHKEYFLISTVMGLSQWIDEYFNFSNDELTRPITRQLIDVINHNYRDLASARLNFLTGDVSDKTLLSKFYKNYFIYSLSQKYIHWFSEAVTPSHPGKDHQHCVAQTVKMPAVLASFNIQKKWTMPLIFHDGDIVMGGGRLLLDLALNREKENKVNTIIASSKPIDNLTPIKSMSELDALIDEKYFYFYNLNKHGSISSIVESGSTAFPPILIKIIDDLWPEMQTTIKNYGELSPDHIISFAQEYAPKLEKYFLPPAHDSK